MDLNNNWRLSQNKPCAESHRSSGGKLNTKLIKFKVKLLNEMLSEKVDYKDDAIRGFF